MIRLDLPRPVLLVSLVMAALLALLWSTSSAQACGRDSECRVDKGYYFVAPPPGWDGRTPIGALVFLHAHRATAAEMMRYGELVDAAHALGLMLVAPQGSGESWSHRGVSAWRNLRDENAFLVSVLDDLERRFPIDRARLIGSGFSQGASTLWYFACDVPGRLRAFVTIAGVFWQPMPEGCTAGPVDLLHIHGTADTVMPVAGRLFRGTFGQGNMDQAFAKLLVLNSCRTPPDTTQTMGELTCRSWNSCASGRSLRLCLHGGDHHTNPVWFALNRDWLDSVAR